MHAYTWEDPEIHQTGTLNQANQNDWPKETRKKYSKKVIQTAMMMQLKDSPSECTSASSHTYCTLLLLINTSLAPLLSVFVEILFCIVEGPGPLSLTSGLAARIWHSHISGWEPKPRSKPLQSEATRDQILDSVTGKLFSGSETT